MISKFDITKLRTKIYNLKQKIAKDKYSLSNEKNNKKYEDLLDDINKNEKELKLDITNFNKQTEDNKKEKIIFYKSLDKLKLSITEFSKLSKENTKLKRIITEFNTGISLIEREINNL